MGGVVLDLHDVGVAMPLGLRASPKSSLLSWFQGKRRPVFWALRHVTLSVAEGEILGIVGRNGAGKSTLMQLLAGTLAPDEGTVAIHGRPTPLLSLDFGANNELTGRQNLELMGLFLGLSPARIAEVAPRCIEFSELGTFVDEPMKHYSSGMAGRLGLALALSLEPDVLLVDEVLGVGDEGFRQKCQDEMRRLMERSRAIVVVSHKLDYVESVCTRALWLHQGELRAEGEPAQVVAAYRAFMQSRRGRVVREDAEPVA